MLSIVSLFSLKEGYNNESLIVKIIYISKFIEEGL